jgi:hypothetical protein
MLTYSVLALLLHDNARARTPTRTTALLEHFNWELPDHRACSPDLAPSDYRLFTYLKLCLGSQSINNNEKIVEGIKTSLSSQVADFFDTGIQKPIPRYGTCLNSDGNYVEKQLKYV